jgi:hypothetical protein
VFSEDLVPMVLSGTDFGQDWIARSIMAVMLAAALLAARPRCDSRSVQSPVSGRRALHRHLSGLHLTRAHE